MFCIREITRCGEVVPATKAANTKLWVPNKRILQVRFTWNPFTKLETRNSKLENYTYENTCNRRRRLYRLASLRKTSQRRPRSDLRGQLFYRAAGKHSPSARQPFLRAVTP